MLTITTKVYFDIFGEKFSFFQSKLFFKFFVESFEKFLGTNLEKIFCLNFGHIFMKNFWKNLNYSAKYVEKVCKYALCRYVNMNYLCFVHTCYVLCMYKNFEICKSICSWLISLVAISLTISFASIVSELFLIGN